MEIPLVIFVISLIGVAYLLTRKNMRCKYPLRLLLSRFDQMSAGFNTIGMERGLVFGANKNNRIYISSVYNLALICVPADVSFAMDDDETSGMRADSLTINVGY